ncbi:condensation domain-containing protein [Streptomyces sp. NPDC058268]|uniref:condensation domain-containing protein n=1 Tax=Streptomyces sp. NPDC058268 TaxID=3346413 RepID=UPI0036F03C31
MSTDHAPHSRPDAPMTVVVDLAGAPGPALPVLELRGPLDTHRLEAALDRIDRESARPARRPLWRHRLEEHGPGHHTLRLTARASAGSSVDFPAGLLADLLTDTPRHEEGARRIVPTSLQRELIADSDAHPGTGRHSEQFAFAWNGPLDPDRFTTAWQSVFDRESVLRATFEDGPEPQLVLHERITPEVVHLPHAATDWYALVEADRRRGLDPRGPGPLRITVLAGGPPGQDTPAPARVLLTFHHALLDGWSVRSLLQEFYRAYLADGALPGGERRPDIGDYAHWLTAQDTAPARDFWSRNDLAPATEPPAAALTGAGVGHARTRLDTEETERLRTWAAALGSPESSVLHAVWALLLYRARGTVGPARVRFSSTVSGRGIHFDGVERLPAPLRNPLPVTVDVDPCATVLAVLAGLRDEAVDRGAYEWVTAGQIRSWSGARDTGASGSLLVFEHRPCDPDGLTELLAAQGILVGSPETLGVRTAFPLTLVAHHGDDGGLVVTASYDRTRLGDADQVLADTAFLLRQLPGREGERTTVGEVLALLDDLPRPLAPGPDRTAGPPSDDTEVPPLVVLRPATHPGAGTVCLIQTPSTPHSVHTRVVRAYRGPEMIALLRPAAGSRRHEAVLRALREGPLVLGGFSGGGVAAYEIARSVAASGGRAPVVVLTGAATRPADFARTLEATARRSR